MITQEQQIKLSGLITACEMNWGDVVLASRSENHDNEKQKIVYFRVREKLLAFLDSITVSEASHVAEESQQPPQ